METRETYLAQTDYFGDLERIKAWGEFAKQAGVIPQNMTPLQAAMIIQTGRELGLPPAYSLRNFFFVNGRIGELTQSQWARAYRAGVRLVHCRITNRGAWVKLKRGEMEVEDKFDEEDRKRANLNSTAWQQYPDVMYWNRALGKALKKICPDITAGIYTFEEAMEIPAEASETLPVITIEPEIEPDHDIEPAPPPEPQPRRRARQQSEAQANGDVDPELAEWRTRVAQKWAELYPMPEGVSRQEQARLLRERHQRLLEFAQSQYPDISDVKQLTVEQLQHLASLMDVDEFLTEAS